MYRLNQNLCAGPVIIVILKNKEGSVHGQLMLSMSSGSFSRVYKRILGLLYTIPTITYAHCAHESCSAAIP